MKRSSFLKYDDEIALGKRPLVIWAYGRTRRFACRLEINATGIAVFTSPNGQQKIADHTWERFVKILVRKQERR